MKLLVANALEEIGYEQLAIELISNVNKRNLYFMKFIKLKTLCKKILCLKNNY